MSVTTSTIPVRFASAGTGTAELTWGQRAIWETVRSTGRTLNIGGVMPLPPGTPVEEMAAVLRFLVGRHQALRTRLRPDPAGQRPPQQEVFAEGEILLHVVDLDGDEVDGDELDGQAGSADPQAGTDSAAERAAEELRDRFEQSPFDFTAEWPVRMGVVCRGGAPTHLVVQYAHVMLDGFGIEAAVRDLAHLDPATGAPRPGAPEPGGPHQLDLARFQHGPAGRRLSAKSIRYWENLLAPLPAERFPGSDDPREPRFREILCYSPALHLALDRIAARTGAAPSHVLLASYAVALARVTGRSPSVAQLIVNNRFRPGFADAVAQLCQTGFCVIDVADCGFDEVVQRAWKAAGGALLHGYYNPIEHHALMAELAARRGAPVDISCFVNDRRNHPGPAAGEPLVTPERLRAARELTRIRWDRALPTYDGTFYLHVDSAPDVNVPGRIRPDESGVPAVYFTIWADTHALSPAAIEDCARGLEAAAVEAAFDGSVPTGISTAVQVV